MNRRFLTALLCLVPLMPARVEATPVSPHLEKADLLISAYLLNFLKYTRWEPVDMEDPERLFVIGVLGAEDFSPVLERVTSKKVIGSRPIQVKRFDLSAASNSKTEGGEALLDSMRSCHMLFVRADGASLERIRIVLGRLDDPDLLVVGEGEGFRGGEVAVNLYTWDGRIAFAIDQASLSGKRFALSSKLLRLAKQAGLE